MRRRQLLLAGAAATVARLAGAQTAKAAPVTEWPVIHLLDGNTLNPATWQGQTAVIVFWATYCPYCKRHNTRADKLHRATSGGGGAIGPHRGRRARRRPLPASSIRPPSPSPCHATAGAAPVLHPWTNPSSSTPSATRRGVHGRRACATLLVRTLPRAGAGVQPLRPGPDLLRHGLRCGGSPAVAA